MLEAEIGALHNTLQTVAGMGGLKVITPGQGHVPPEAAQQDENGYL